MKQENTPEDRTPGDLAEDASEPSPPGIEDWDPGSRPLDAWLDDPGRPDPARLVAALRATRPDGSPVFGPRGRSPARLARLRAWADEVADPGASTVLDWWVPRRVVSPEAAAPPPLPSFARRERPLAVLRPDWTARGDLVAIDHRAPGDASLVEVSGRGRTWVGPSWASGPPPARLGQPRMTSWTTGAFADCAEWSYRTDRGRVTRTAVLLRGRGLAILAEQRHGDLAHEPASMRLGLPEGVEALPIEGSRSLTLSFGRGRPVARAVPFGLPPAVLGPGRGSFAAEGRELVLRPASEGPRAWLPLAISWGKPPTSWRILTVSEKSRACPPHVAVGYRLAWGPGDEGLLIYRSLAPAALRAVLGHQTRARFLVGVFTRSGDVRPLLKLD